MYVARSKRIIFFYEGDVHTFLQVGSNNEMSLYSGGRADLQLMFYIVPERSVCNCCLGCS